MPRLAIAIACLAAAGCCSAPPAVEKYFDRRSPTSALLGLAYSVEIGNWEYAYDSLTLETRSQIKSPLDLEIYTIWAEDPDFGIAVRDVLTTAIAVRFPPVPVAGRADVVAIRVWYPDDEAPELPKIELSVFLQIEEGEWRVDLIRTFVVNYPEQVQPT
ncbi:MAG: hypothetical protein JXA90_02000 [Planctomycetes bacterium]|nr:hypothetical protein [Planctomycetota bacterium]